MVQQIIDQNVRLIITAENDVFNNYLRTKTKIVKNNYFKKTDPIPYNINNFWFVCQNN